MPKCQPDVVETLEQPPPAVVIKGKVRANVRASANQLRHGSEVVEDFIERNGLCVVGAEYSLETGVVEFFEGV